MPAFCPETRLERKCLMKVSSSLKEAALTKQREPQSTQLYTTETTESFSLFVGNKKIGINKIVPNQADFLFFKLTKSVALN